MVPFDLFYSYCGLQGLSPRTIRAIRSAVELLCRSYPNPLEVTPEQAMRFFVHGKNHGFASDRPASPSHFNNIRKYLNKFYGWAVAAGYCRENPISGIPRCKVPKALPRRLQADQVLRLLYHAGRFPHPSRFLRTRNYALVAVLLMAGLRAREALNLRCDDLDLNRLVLRVRAGKGGKDREVFFNRDLLYILRDYLEERQRLKKVSAFLFVAYASNLPLRYKNLRAVLGRVSRVAGVHFTAHVLRHTCFSMLAEQQVSMPAIQAQAGHSSIVSTQVYVQISDEARRRAVQGASFLGQ